MFCPNCGLDEKNPNQFCRACGTDLKPVADAVGRPDSITGSAVSAREEIGRAVAAKIRETQSVRELKKVTEDILPEIEKFLESPAEKRLRRIRTGTIISCVGLGVAFSMFLVAIFSHNEDTLFLAGLGGIAAFIGLAFILNGYFSTVAAKTVADHSTEADQQRNLDAGYAAPALGEPAAPFRSVTENTTTHLAEKMPVGRD